MSGCHPPSSEGAAAASAAPHGGSGGGGDAVGARSSSTKPTADRVTGIERASWALMSREAGLPEAQVKAVAALLGEGATVPFIVRYRKEIVGELTADQVRAVAEGLERVRTVEARRAAMLASILRRFGKVDREIRMDLQRATDLHQLEAAYLPFKERKATLGDRAAELPGLSSLAGAVWKHRPEFDLEAARRRAERDLGSTAVATALRHILAQKFSEASIVRRRLYEHAKRRFIVSCSRRRKGTAKKQGDRDCRRHAGGHETFRDYFDFTAPVSSIRAHQVLAINRAEKAGVLSVSFKCHTRTENIPASRFEGVATRMLKLTHGNLVGQKPHLRQPVDDIRLTILREAAQDAWSRLLLPRIGRELRRELTQTAERHALGVFKRNLRQLLLSRPLPHRRVLGFDPGFRHGCKLAVVDQHGSLRYSSVIFPHPPRSDASAGETLVRLLVEHRVDVIAIGDGTASRESAVFVAGCIRRLPADRSANFCTVSEAGASVYSVSSVAAAEFPGVSPDCLGAVSIARRLQDPLSELCKVDPTALGVGMYQHDLSTAELAKCAANTVEDCVNEVGIDVNTASIHVLRHVAGLNSARAQAIFDHRRSSPIRRRDELLSIRGIGPRTYEQCAGFLRVRCSDHGGSGNYLDDTLVHPESYDVANAVLQRCGTTLDRFADRTRWYSDVVPRLRSIDAAPLARELGIGLPTLRDVVAALENPGYDPREKRPAPKLRASVLRLTDLRSGMKLDGVVRNVVDFGCFVDVGIKEDGLLHASKFIAGTIGIGDVIEVIVDHVEPERGRLKLSLPSQRSQHLSHSEARHDAVVSEVTSTTSQRQAGLKRGRAASDEQGSLASARKARVDAS